MKRSAILAAGLLAALLPSGARAAAVGAYLSGGSGDADGRAAVHAGGGVVLDTGVGRQRLFGYRLQLGYDRLEMAGDSQGGRALDGVAADSYFGFRLGRGEAGVFWLGPEVLLGWSGGRDEGPTVGIGAGAAFDAPLSEDLTLSLLAGYRDVLHVYALDDLNERLWHADVSLLWGKTRTMP